MQASCSGCRRRRRKNAAKVRMDERADLELDVIDLLLGSEDWTPYHTGEDI